MKFKKFLLLACLGIKLPLIAADTAVKRPILGGLIARIKNTDFSHLPHTADKVTKVGGAIIVGTAASALVGYLGYKAYAWYHKKEQPTLPFADITQKANKTLDTINEQVIPQLMRTLQVVEAAANKADTALPALQTTAATATITMQRLAPEIQTTIQAARETAHTAHAAITHIAPRVQTAVTPLSTTASIIIAPFAWTRDYIGSYMMRGFLSGIR